MWVGRQDTKMGCAVHWGCGRAVVDRSRGIELGKGQGKYGVRVKSRVGEQ